jgi:hypothetical protein
MDLLNSFRFDNDDLRKSSGFKMKGFKITAIHYLGDWRADLEWAMIPKRSAGSRQIDINNEVSFLVRWAPISEIKSNIIYNQNEEPTWVVK